MPSRPLAINAAYPMSASSTDYTQHTHGKITNKYSLSSGEPGISHKLVFELKYLLREMFHDIEKVSYHNYINEQGICIIQHFVQMHVLSSTCTMCDGNKASIYMLCVGAYTILYVQ